jgi:L-seryl-tRNA(Ser) seleniumtransferase
LLKVHCSNFAVVGFTAEVTARELVPLAAEFGLPVMADVGSGNLIDLANMPLVDEPTITSYLRAGVDVVTFSGDKLLGGPQAGIIVGKRKFIEPMQKHPLLRALRIDKMTLAALEGTLSLYRDPKRAVADIPTLRMLAATSEELASQGKMLLRKLKRELPSSISFSLVAGHSQVGGGALPLVQLPTQLIAVTVDTLSPQELDQRLRTGAIAVVGRIHKNQYLLDVRTILDEDLPLLTTALSQLVS